MYILPYISVYCTVYFGSPARVYPPPPWCGLEDGEKCLGTLDKGDIQLRVGNGAIISATDVGDVDLSLPTGLILHLSGVYFCPCTTPFDLLGFLSAQTVENYFFFSILHLLVGAS